jgi:translation elongation factor EF-G
MQSSHLPQPWLYYSKLAGGPKDRKLLAFGRIFSGTIQISTLLQVSGIAFELLEPIIGYRETAEVVLEITLAKIYSKHNCVYIQVSPVPNNLLMP